jgi:hypothetical protein
MRSLMKKPRNRALRDIYAELSLFRVDSRRAPQRIRDAHLRHQRRNGLVSPGGPVVTVGNVPSTSAQPLAMPAHDGVWLDDDQCPAPVPPYVGEEDPEGSIARPQLWTFDGALQGRERRQHGRSSRGSISQFNRPASQLYCAEGQGKRNVWDVGLVQPTHSPGRGTRRRTIPGEGRDLLAVHQRDRVKQIEEDGAVLFMSQSGLGAGTQRVD